MDTTSSFLTRHLPIIIIVLPIITIIYLSLLLFTYHYYYLPIIIIIHLSLLVSTFHYYYFAYHY